MNPHPSNCMGDLSKTYGTYICCTYILKENDMKWDPCLERNIFSIIKYLSNISSKIKVLLVLETKITGWWCEGQFRAKSTSAEWKTSKFRKSVQIIVILLSRVFRRKDGASFLDKWIPIIYQVITSGSTLN